MNESLGTSRIEAFSRQSPFPPRDALSRWIETDRTRVLDIGSGTGLWAFEAASLGAAIVDAIDQDAARAALIAERAESEGVQRIRSRMGQAENLPLIESSIDLVVASLVLHEVADLSKALREIHRVLAPNGTVIVVELLPTGHDQHPRLAPESLREAVSAEGLSVVSLEIREGWYCLVCRSLLIVSC